MELESDTGASPSGPGTGTAGTVNLGGGGGGGADNSAAGNGGSGIVALVESTPNASAWNIHDHFDNVSNTDTLVSKCISRLFSGCCSSSVDNIGGGGAGGYRVSGFGPVH